MTCAESRDLLPLHAAGALGDDARFRSHLAVCEGCARRAELHRRVWDLAGLAVEETVPAEAVRGVYARVGRGPRLGLLRLGGVAAAAVLAWFALAPGAPEPPVQMCVADEPRSGYVEPAFGELSVAEGEAPGPLGLRSHSVRVEIGDWGMRTEVEEVFVNASDRRLEGTFQFPLPADASLSRFAMEVNGALVEGELVERVRAREVYEGIVRRMEDPALLEWMPGNLFKARVFPIEPRSEKRVVLAYTQAPRMWNGSIRYAYPLVSEKTRACPPERLSVRADLRFGRAIRSLEVPTHAADVARPDARSARITLSVRNARPTQDFQLRAEMEPDEIEAASHRPSAEEGFLGIAFAPRAAAPPGGAGTYVFVIDRSTRMGEQELSVARRVVDRMLDRLGPADAAGFVAHHVENAVLPPERVTPERRRRWRDFLRDLRGEGASDVAGALRAAAAVAPEGATVVYVGKGVPTWGEAELAAPAGRAFRAVLIGSGANEGLGALGAAQSILPGGEVEAEIGAVARTIGVRPVEVEEVLLEGAEASGLEPERLGAVYPGERVHLFARYRGERATVVIRGRADGRPCEWRREVALAAGPTEHGSLPRLWAHRALQARAADCRRRGEPRELVEEIVAMSRAYQVMTPYTSFLVLESEEAYRQHRIDRARRREEEAGKEEEQGKRRLGPEASPADPAVRREVLRKMARLLELSYMAFDQRRYERCIRLCEEVLLIDPKYGVARELREDAEKTRHKDEYHSILSRKVEQWKRLTDDGEAAAVPGSETLRLPSREEWAEISRRITGSVIRHEGTGSLEEDADLLAIHRKLDTMKVDLSGRGMKLDEALARLRDSSGLNIVVDAGSASSVDPVRVMDLDVRGGVLKDTLRQVLSQQGLDYTITRENVVLITPRGEAREGTRRMMDQKRELELLFGQAHMYLERGQHGWAIEAADKILRINPNLTSVMEMKHVARRLGHMKEGRDDLKPYIEDWKRTFERIELNAAVQADILDRPDMETWKELISKRKPKGIAELEDDIKPEDQEILNKLKSIRITIDMQNAPLTAIIDYIREISGLNMHLSGVDNAESEMISFNVADIVLDGALRLLLGPRRLTYIVRDGVVLITRAPGAAAERRDRMEEIRAKMRAESREGGR